MVAASGSVALDESIGWKVSCTIDFEKRKSSWVGVVIRLVVGPEVGC